QQPPILPPALRSPQLANRLSRLVEPLAIDKYNGDTAINGLLALAGVSSAIFVPVVWQSELYAVIVVGSDSEVLPQSLRASSDLTINERLKGVANIAAPVLRNALLLAQVQYEALHDQTTGLPNTRLLQDEIVRALSHAERQGNQAAILFVDLDNFSQVNDSLGHVAADDVLRATGMILRSAVRRGDVVARLAGDQFAVLLPNVRGEEDAKLVAYKVIRALEIPFNDFDQVVSISASVGIAVYPDHGTSYDELLGRSDIAMRRAKAGGGDRLVIFSS
ncbi:MAG TPA: GGDEF domain-containing protein, partial [Acidimicrobiales bacterium]|nr:GGDEF domain-containing protein [Acidimicrobiales bacterium]